VFIASKEEEKIKRKIGCRRRVRLGKERVDEGIGEVSEDTGEVRGRRKIGERGKERGGIYRGGLYTECLLQAFSA
jgi:hypothetical protein